MPEVGTYVDVPPGTFGSEWHALGVITGPPEPFVEGEYYRRQAPSPMGMGFQGNVYCSAPFYLPALEAPVVPVEWIVNINDWRDAHPGPFMAVEAEP